MLLAGRHSTSHHPIKQWPNGGCEQCHKEDQREKEKWLGDISGSLPGGDGAEVLRVGRTCLGTRREGQREGQVHMHSTPGCGGVGTWWSRYEIGIRSEGEAGEKRLQKQARLAPWSGEARRVHPPRGGGGRPLEGCLEG